MRKSIGSLALVAVAVLAALTFSPSVRANPIAQWVDFPASEISPGVQVDLAATIVSLDPGFTGISSIAWSFDGGGGTALSPDGSNPSTFLYAAAGDYEVSFTGTGTEYYNFTNSYQQWVNSQVWVTSGYYATGAYWHSTLFGGYWVYYQYWVDTSHWEDTSHYETYYYTDTYYQLFTVSDTGTIMVRSSPPSIPDNSSTALILAVGLLGLAALRRGWRI